MAYTIVGDDPIDRGNYTGPNQGWTWIVATTPAKGRGIVKQVQVFVYSAGTMKLKFFRDDGANYLYLGESPTLNVSVGLNMIPFWLPIEKNDLIGFYIAASGSAAIDCGTVGEGGTSSFYKAGDITVNTLKSAWTVSNRYQSIQGKIFARVGLL